MKKNILLILVLTFITFGVFAQNTTNNNSTPQFSIGISPGVAVGSVSSVYPDAGEITLRLTYPLSNNSPVSLTFTTGYTFYTSGNAYSVGVDYGGFGFEAGGGGDDYYGDVASFIPVMAGLKVYVAPKFFIEGEVGASFNVNSNSQFYTGRETALIYSPAIGYTLPLGYSGRHSADLSLAYENRVEPGGGYQQIAFHAAYNFGL